MAKHILYSTTQSKEGGNFYAYHLPKAWLHVELFEDPQGLFTIHTHPHILPDPDEVFQLKYTPHFTTNEKIQVKFQAGGYLQQITTDKSYPKTEKPPVSHFVQPNLGARNLAPRPGMPQGSVKHYEQYVDPFDTEALVTLNQRLAQYDKRLGLKINDLGVPNNSMPITAGEMKPGIFCRPQVPVVVIAQEGATARQHLIHLPQGRSRQFIEIPPARGTNSLLEVYFDDWGVPTAISLEKGSGSFIWLHNLKAIVNSLLESIGQIVKIRVNQLGGETKAMQAELAHRQALAQLAQFERQSQQAEVRARSAEAIAQNAQVQLKEQAHALARRPIMVPTKEAEPEMPLIPGEAELADYDLQLQLVRTNATEKEIFGQLFVIDEGKTTYLGKTKEVAAGQGDRDEPFLLPETYGLRLLTDPQNSRNKKYAALFSEAHKGLIELDGPGRPTLYRAQERRNRAAGSILLEAVALPEPLTKASEDGLSADAVKLVKEQLSAQAYLTVYTHIADALVGGKTAGLQIIALAD